MTAEPLVRSDLNLKVSHAPGREGSCWPTVNQQLLLKAALSDQPIAEAACQAWHDRVDLDSIDAGSYRLLPLLYSNLVRHRIASPLLHRLKGIHRHAWFRNQVLFRDIAEIVDVFRARGIRTLLLKGAALSLTTYRDAAVRPMCDGDLLVPLRDARSALTILKEHGWLPQPEPVMWPPRHRPSWPFRRGTNREIDLHWHVIAECLDDRSDDDFWSAAVPIDVHGAPTRVLCPADQLFHVIVHGLVRSSVPPIRWVADAAVVLTQSTATIDWARLYRVAAERRLAWTMRLALEYLNRDLALPVPSSALELFASYRAPVGERLEHWSKVEPGVIRLAGRLWFGYSRSTEGAGERRTPAGFHSYLQNFWQVDGTWPLVRVILGKAARRTRAMVGRDPLSRPAAVDPNSTDAIL